MFVTRFILKHIELVILVNNGNNLWAEMVMGRNGYGPILSWAEMVMGRNDQLPLHRITLPTVRILQTECFCDSRSVENEKFLDTGQTFFFFFFFFFLLCFLVKKNIIIIK